MGSSNTFWSGDVNRSREFQSEVAGESERLQNMRRFVFDFDHDHGVNPKELKDLLGGKGANLAEMTSFLELPVPPGFTISTSACQQYFNGEVPVGLIREIQEAKLRLERNTGKILGSPSNPLLVSVRSGAKFSMPGMMDTVLNLGLNDHSVNGLAEQTQDQRFALDTYRRFISMFARIVLNADGAPFEVALEDVKSQHGYLNESSIGVDELLTLVRTYKDLVLDLTGSTFPQDPELQLFMSIEAVFASWAGPRAIAYREHEGISHELGTAVNVQSMVFGNRDNRSGTGVGFTRNPATGLKNAYGDFLVNAQGEDVVAGIRITQPLDDLEKDFPLIHDQLVEIFDRLERHFGDMCDTEFTIEQDRLWMLQTRVGKRTGRAAIRMAVEMANEYDLNIGRDEALRRVSEEHLDQVLHPQFEVPHAIAIGNGLGASPGAAVGRCYFYADDVVAAVDRGEKALLVRSETSPDDVHGILAAEGVLTSRGGLVSHAAVIARGWGKPAVVGTEQLVIYSDYAELGNLRIGEGDWLSIDGSSGEIIPGIVPLVASEASADLVTLLDWADEVRRGHLKVRANADTGEDAMVARALGAEGIGLCRTEHMFLAEDRLPIVRRMILAKTPAEEKSALEELELVQRTDFYSILEAMDGLPVTVRLLDPPLHEFLPSIEELVVKEAHGNLDELDQELLAAARS
jgi:pyruvate,orthophosphate dikinase